ncbi:hypothetical protein BGZ73_006175 [Actinomortierella ambigua]|nr:hypothetical protein BGZ73_006175 [Actinomortierella ambigua]
MKFAMIMHAMSATLLATSLTWALPIEPLQQGAAVASVMAADRPLFYQRAERTANAPLAQSPHAPLLLASSGSAADAVAVVPMPREEAPDVEDVRLDEQDGQYEEKQESLAADTGVEAYIREVDRKRLDSRCIGRRPCRT